MKPAKFFSLIVAVLIALPAGLAMAIPQGWTTDYEAAKTAAAENNRSLLLYFTGSDWCPPCIALKQEVFLTEDFEAEGKENYELVYLDFPQLVPQSQELIDRNTALAERYAISVFPTVILADAEGLPYAQTSYQPGGPKAYLKHLADLQDNLSLRDRALTRAAEQEGGAKAKSLDKAMSVLDPGVAATHYPDVIDDIIKLDPENKLGLKSKYESALVGAQVDAGVQTAIELFQAGSPDKAQGELDRILSEYNPKGENRQFVLAMKGQMRFQVGDTDSAFRLFEEAIAVAPASATAAEIKQILRSVRP
ncbi:MAG: thioredoxin family protein [Planctomycetota bacterium]